MKGELSQEDKASWAGKRSVTRLRTFLAGATLVVALAIIVLLGRNKMEKRALGKTGLEVSRLGLGLAWIGFELTLNETQQAGEVINTALDSGINLLDTAACYGISEELIGRTVAHRRHEYYLATKCGHGGTGADWSRETVNENIDRSLKRMRTDYLDIVQLHSCGVNILEQSDAVQALLDAKKAGKTRFIGHSGDNESARWVIESGFV